MDNQTLWQSALAEIELSISANIFASFFKNTKLASFNKGVVEINVPNSVIASYLESRYLMLIKSVIEKRIKETVSVIFSVEKKGEGETGPLFSPQSTIFAKNIALPDKTSILCRKAGLKEDFSFESFAVSSSNEMAFAAAQAVAASPGKAYNPFFLYGGVGVGKTHLSQAVAKEILKANPETKILYTTGEEFTNGIIDAIRTKTTGEFKRTHRNLDVLILDDVQFLAGKEQIQEEFFHTFNAVEKSGGQIILTSDKPPEEIDRIDERMKSRFKAGLIVDIGAPNFELRCAILKIKAEKKDLSLPVDTIQFLGETIKSAREIEGALLSIKSWVASKKIDDLSISSIKKVLNIKEEKALVKKFIDQASVLNAVCEYFDIKQTVLKGEKRNKQIVIPRQILMYLLKKHANMTYEEIGNFLGGRDHTTAMHGVETIENKISSDPSLQKKIFDLVGKISD